MLYLSAQFYYRFFATNAVRGYTYTASLRLMKRSLTDSNGKKITAEMVLIR